jgi:hypothetical protein
LEAHHIKDNDFLPLPLPNVDHDFVSDLKFNYLQELKKRMKSGSYEDATIPMILRKCIKLGDMDYLVEECQEKSDILLKNATKLSK